MQVKKWRISITTRLLSYLLLAGIVPLVVLGVSAFDISRSIIIQQAGEFHLQQMTDLRAFLALYADQIESLSENIAGNEAIGEALRVKKTPSKSLTDTFSMLRINAQIGYMLNSYVRVKGLVSIDLFSPDDKHFHVGDTLDFRDVDDIRVHTMLDEANRSLTPAHWRGIEDNLNLASAKKKVLTLTRVIRYFVPQTGTTEVIGLLVINVDANVVITAFLNEVKTSDHLLLMLLDRHGRFVYHSDDALIGQEAAPSLMELLRSGPSIRALKLDGEEVILGFIPDTRMGGFLVGALPHSVLTAPTYALIYSGLVLLLIGIAAIGLLAWQFARRVVAPVRDVSEGFRRLQERPDALPPALPLPDAKDEMADMVAGFNCHLDVLASQRTAAHQLFVAQQAVEAAAELEKRNAALSEEISRREAAEKEIRSLAFYDQLTGLPNRRLLVDRLRQAMASSARNKKCSALLFIDLDNFKTLNDTLGHDIGDLLLKQVAQRLTACVREGDTVARQGGDEFVVVLEDLSENHQEAASKAETVGEKILATLNQTYQLANQNYLGTPSIGITLFAGHDGTSDELLKRADLAMYQAKAAGRNTLRFFDPEMQAVVSARVAMEASLREALVNKQFLLYYQAQVTDKGNLTGAEVLLRWQDPRRGMIPPAEFIPLAEDTGLILPIGKWVLETACAQLAIWATRPEMAHLTIAVNISARQFKQPSFVDDILSILQYSGANPQRLKLELTESLLVDNVEDIITKMAVLKAKGVGFSLDDFGTGYSSLSYLKRMPLDQLKIDKGFVRDILIDPNDAAIAKMIIALAESLGLAVIAEGVETVAQKEFLARQGCHAYQGYLFGRPLSLEAFEEFSKRV